MRRYISLITGTVIIAAVALLGACTNATNSTTPVNNTPANHTNVGVATPMSSPATTPVASPSASPAASPAKPGASPEVKKDDKKVDGKNVNKDAKPVATASPKAK